MVHISHLTSHCEPEGGLSSEECAANTKPQLGVPGIAADDQWKLKSWPAVFTFPSRGCGWLEQIPFVQILSTQPTGVASMPRALKRFGIPSKRLP